MLLPSALGFSPHPPVSVYGTGTSYTIAAFLGTWLTCFPTNGSVHITSSDQTADLPTALLPRLYASFHSALMLSTCVPAVLICRSTGISTCCPSATPFGLTLGPDFPRADQLYSGNLGYSAGRILTFLSLLIPAGILSSMPSTAPYGTASLSMQCSSTTRTKYKSSASVSCFSPVYFRRRTSRPVSYYALFECVAASEPTSWLSLKSHILSHLTRTLGP